MFHQRLPIPELEFMSSVSEYLRSKATAIRWGKVDCTDRVASAFPANDSMKNSSWSIMGPPKSCCYEAKLTFNLSFNHLINLQKAPGYDQSMCSIRAAGRRMPAPWIRSYRESNVPPQDFAIPRPTKALWGPLVYRVVEPLGQQSTPLPREIT